MTLDVAARAWLGTRWRHLGRNDQGLDCIGLVLVSAAGCGIFLPDPAPYARLPQDTALAAGLAQHADRVGQASPGDILLFRMGLYAGHVGIASIHPVHGGAAVIHAFARHATEVCEQPMTDEFRLALVGAYRLRG